MFNAARLLAPLPLTQVGLMKIFRVYFLFYKFVLVNLCNFNKVSIPCRFPYNKILAEQKSNSEEDVACLVNKRSLRIWK